MRHISTFTAYRGAHALGLFLAFTGFALVAFGCGLAWGADGEDDPNIVQPGDGEPQYCLSIDRRWWGEDETHECAESEGDSNDYGTAEFSYVVCSVEYVQTLWFPMAGELSVCPGITTQKIVRCPPCPDPDDLPWGLIDTMGGFGPSSPLGEGGE